MTRPKLVLAVFAGAVLLTAVFELHHATRAYATNPDTTPVTGTITVQRKYHDESNKTIKQAGNGGSGVSNTVFTWTEQETSSYTGINAQPPGNVVDGDSIALYDEYRGFHIGGKHERLSPMTKDLFVYDFSKLGYGAYMSATGVNAHLVSSAEVGESGGTNPYTVSPNGTHGKVYAVLLRARPISDGSIGTTNPRPSTPDNVSEVAVDPNSILRAYGTSGPAEVLATIGHELCHASNIIHHGDGYEYNVGDVTCRRDDGTVKNYVCSSHPKGGGVGTAAQGCFEVAGKGGKYSGNDQCIMRYDMGEFFQDPDGNCHAQYNGAPITLSVYGQDPPGFSLCKSAEGTGVNAPPPHKHCKAGNAHVGNCRGQLQIKCLGK